MVQPFSPFGPVVIAALQPTGYYLLALRADPASVRDQSVAFLGRRIARPLSFVPFSGLFVQSREEHFPKLNVLQGSKIHRHSNSPQGEDLEVTITNRDRNALCVFLSRPPTELCQRGNLRLATVARSGARRNIAGARPPETMARGRTKIDLAGERHRRRLFNASGCRHADLFDEQPGHGE